jgi:CRISPR-associated DxTHG motif protein
MSSNHIILSFLGVGRYVKETDENVYDETTYQWKGESCTTSFIQVAVHKFFPCEQHFVACTDIAFEKQGEKLKQVLDFNRVSIPDGNNENEVWEMFKCIADAIPAKSSLILDVTHGFRHQPMMALAIAVYLRVVKQVQIERIVYGAYDARNKDANISPVFDLTPFLQVIDWAVATEQFLKYGNANFLRDILKTVHLQSRKDSSGYQAKSLQSFGKKLAELSEALSLVRPDETPKIVKETQKILLSVKEELGQIPYAYPLLHLLNQSDARLAQFRIQEDENLFTASGFKVQAAMLRYYIETEQFVQAATLAREAMVSKYCVLKNYNPIGKEDRKKVEELLNCVVKVNQEEKNKNVENVFSLWGKITQLRNDLNHAGMRDYPLLASKAIKQVKDCGGQIALWLEA